VEELENGEKQYTVGINNREAMPDPYSELRIREAQADLLELVLYYEVEDPDNPGEYLMISDDWVKYKHRDSNYAEECSYPNKC
jgi:hypothetical protein